MAAFTEADEAAKATLILHLQALQRLLGALCRGAVLVGVLNFIFACFFSAGDILSSSSCRWRSFCSFVSPPLGFLPESEGEPREELPLFRGGGPTIAPLQGDLAFLQNPPGPPSSSSSLSSFPALRSHPAESLAPVLPPGKYSSAM